MRTLFPNTDIRTFEREPSRISLTAGKPSNTRQLTRLPDAILPNHSVLHASLEPEVRIDEDVLLPDADVDALDVDVGRVGIEGLPMESALLRVRGDEGFFDGRSDGGIRGCR